MERWIVYYLTIPSHLEMKQYVLDNYYYLGDWWDMEPIEMYSMAQEFANIQDMEDFVSNKVSNNYECIVHRQEFDTSYWISIEVQAYPA
jgi:hypothetical protein